MTANKFSPVAFTALLATLAAPQVSLAAPHLTQDEATNLVKNFGTRLATSPAPAEARRRAVTGSAAKIEYHGSENTDNSTGLPDSSVALNLALPLENKGRSYWKMSKPGVFNIEVDDATGKVVAYMNYATHEALNDQPAGEPISNARALNIAMQAMAAAGQPTDTMKLEWILEEQGHEPPIVSMHKINVAWRRLYQGIPFHQEGGGVVLEAETGDVLSVGIGCTSPDPATTVENISQRQAVTLAEAQLAAVSLPASDLPLMSVQKEIVHPNIYWQTGDTMQAQNESLNSPQTRVVWNCQYGFAEFNYEVCIDAETGDVIAGYHTQCLGGSGQRFVPKFGHQLKGTKLAVKGKA